VRRQRVALAAELKSVLDSWVRFEQQEKENEQARLVKSVVDNVLKNISEERTQKDVLAWAVSEVEREFFSPISGPLRLLTIYDAVELVKNKAI
jgi:F-type H+-transporting ATPase subunit b